MRGTIWKTASVTALISVAACVASAATVTIPKDLGAGSGHVSNGSFEKGDTAPAGWELKECKGTWRKDGSAGKRSVSVSGTGRNNGYWATTEHELKPQTTYRMTTRIKSLEGASDGCITVGPSSNNRDFGHSDDWAERSFIFTTPAKTDGVYVRVGQWHVKGTVAFDDVSIRPVEAIHKRLGEGIVLGEGEEITNGRYLARPRTHAVGSNAFRGLVSHTAGFNSYRWCFGPGSEVVYRHEVGQVEQSAGKVTVSIGYYVRGTLFVEAGTDGTSWRTVGKMSGKGRKTFDVPADLYPVKAVWIRLRASQGKGKNGDSAPGNLQVYSYQYEAKLASKVADAQGATTFVEELKTSPDLGIELAEVRGAGQGLPVIKVRMTSKDADKLRPAIAIDGEQIADVKGTVNVASDGSTELEIPLRLDSAGEYDVLLALADAKGRLRYAARTQVALPVLHVANYGYPVSSDDKVDVWWCEGTYKISKARPAPSGAARPIQIVAAGNEYEPFQLVLRPKHDLRQVRVGVSELKGESGRIAADNVTVNRVDYVYIARPTDRVGCIGDWPDPLPPCDEAFDVPAGQNQPLWITVFVPPGAKPGRYEGNVTIRAADGAAWHVPVALRVLGFSLPKEAHVFATFGLKSWNIWKYHNLETEQERRHVYELYMKNFIAHRITPYNPMELAPYKIDIQVDRPWVGGKRVKHDGATGAFALEVNDQRKNADVHASTADLIPVDPKQRYVLSWRVKTAGPDQPYMVSVNHQDAAGKFIPYHNIDVRLKGSGEWQSQQREIKIRSPRARTVTITLRSAHWTERGENTGKAWFDEVSLKKVGDGKELVRDPGFETAPGKLDVALDFTAFDKAAHHYLDEMGMMRWRLPVRGLGGGTFHSRRKGEIGGFEQGTPEYETLMDKYLGKLEAHLVEKGWIDKAYVYWFDEPSPKDYEFVNESMAVLDRHAPKLTRMLTEQPEPEMYGSVDLWCPLTASYNEKICRQRQALGEDIMWYVCTGPKAPYATLFTDHPAVDLRVWLWQTFKRDIDGILVWTSNYWTSSAAYPGKDYQNPWEDAMSWRQGYSTPAGEKHPWGNGDGRFIYPPNRKGAADKKTKYVCGPINSIRWEMLREGIEDFEYLWQLRHAVQTLRKQGKSGPDIDQAEKLAGVPEDVSKSLTEFNWNPQPMHEHRVKVGLALEKLLAKYGLKTCEKPRW